MAQSQFQMIGSLSPLGLKNSSTIPSQEKTNTLTSLSDLWPVSFKNLQISSRSELTSSQPIKTPSATTMVKSRTSVCSIVNECSNKENNQHVEQKIQQMDDYGLKQSSGRENIKIKSRKYTVTPYLKPLKQNLLTMEKQYLNSYSNLTFKQPILRQQTFQKQIQPNQLNQRNLYITSSVDNKDKFTLKPSLLQRPIKKISESQITNEAYLTPSEYQIFCLNKPKFQKEFLQEQKFITEQIRGRRRVASAQQFMLQKPSGLGQLRISRQSPLWTYPYANTSQIFAQRHSIDSRMKPNPQRPVSQSSYPIGTYFAQSRMALIPTTTRPPFDHCRAVSQIILPVSHIYACAK